MLGNPPGLVSRVNEVNEVWAGLSAKEDHRIRNVSRFVLRICNTHRERMRMSA